MEYTEIINQGEGDDLRKLAVTAPPLSFTKGPANTIQLQVECDDQEAYMDLWPKEAAALRDKLTEWLIEKGVETVAVADPRIEKWEKLGEEIGKYYDQENESCEEEEGSLLDIGEAAAIAYGFL